MVYCDEILDEVHDAIFGNGCEPECDYEAKTINYNTDGDVFYRVNTYGNAEVKSIMVCAAIGEGKEGISAYREVHVEHDDIYAAIDYIVEHMDEINEHIERRIEAQIGGC